MSTLLNDQFSANYIKILIKSDTITKSKYIIRDMCKKEDKPYVIKAIRNSIEWILDNNNIHSVSCSDLTIFKYVISQGNFTVTILTHYEMITV